MSNTYRSHRIILAHRTNSLLLGVTRLYFLLLEGYENILKLKKKTQTVLSHKFTARMKSFFSAFTTNFNFVSSTFRFLRSSGKTTAFWTAAKREKARQLAMGFFYLTFYSKSTPKSTHWREIQNFRLLDSNKINRTMWMHYLVAFIWIVAQKDFIHRLKS